MSGWFNWSPDLEGIAGEGVAEASTQFDELIATANQSVDADERNSAYQQAEELLVQNAVYIPLGHWVQRFVQKPWLQGTRQGPWSGSTPVRFDTEVVLTDPTAT
jgi:ABC-type transport system substrate-binding protein